MGMFTDDERKRLAALLTAADQIREASIVAKAPPLSLSGTVGSDGSLEQKVTVFESEAFRSLAMSMRLVYMNDEPANFGSICNILYKRGDAPLQAAVAETRQAYNDFLKKSKMFQFNLHGAFEGTTVGTEDILESWLYGVAFHQDADERAMFDELMKFGPTATFALHAIVARIVQLILHLAGIVLTALEREKAGSAAPPA